MLLQKIAEGGYWTPPRIGGLGGASDAFKRGHRIPGREPNDFRAVLTPCEVLCFHFCVRGLNNRTRWPVTGSSVCMRSLLNLLQDTHASHKGKGQ